MLRRPAASARAVSLLAGPDGSWAARPPKNHADAVNEDKETKMRRDFFYPHQLWRFLGLRLVNEA